jgi:probable HAF family extracellular repeat protein
MKAEIIDLGNSGGALADASYCTATAINNNGQITGYAELDQHQKRAFRCTQGGRWEDLGDLPGFPDFKDFNPAGINDSGWIVGAALNENYAARPFLWTPERGMQDLGTLGGKSGRATAVNNAGQVVGGADIANKDLRHAFIWSESDGMRDLGILPGEVSPTLVFHYGGLSSEALAVNDHGHIAGWATPPDEAVQHAMMCSVTGDMKDVYSAAMPYRYVTAISNNGHVLGQFSRADWSNVTIQYDTSQWPSLVWLGEGFPKDRFPHRLGGEKTPSSVKLSAVSDDGKIVGQSTAAADDYVACLWLADGTPINLGKLSGGKYSFANDINRDDLIVGWSSDSNRKTRAVLWRLS